MEEPHEVGEADEGVWGLTARRRRSEAGCDAERLHVEPCQATVIGDMNCFDIDLDITFKVLLELPT